MTPLPAFFLAAIRANPDDDAPRLEAADWWEENGEAERAEFIRYQINKRMVSLGHTEKARPWWPHDFSDGPFRDWPDSVFSLLGERSHEVKYSRGFVESIRADASDWLAHGDAILAEHPVTEVRLTSRPLPRGDGERSGLWEDPAGKLFTSEDLNEKFQVGDDLITNLLRLRWPSVRTWHLPPETFRATALRLGVNVEISEGILADNSGGR